MKSLTTMIAHFAATTQLSILPSRYRTRASELWPKAKSPTSHWLADPLESAGRCDTRRRPAFVDPHRCRSSQPTWEILSSSSPRFIRGNPVLPTLSKAQLSDISRFGPNPEGPPSFGTKRPAGDCRRRTDQPFTYRVIPPNRARRFLAAPDPCRAVQEPPNQCATIGGAAPGSKIGNISTAHGTLARARTSSGALRTGRSKLPASPVTSPIEKEIAR